jgi:hypothetical protein
MFNEFIGACIGMCVEKALQLGLSVFTLSPLVKNSEAVGRS